MEEKFAYIIGRSVHINKVEDILTFMRSKVGGKRVTLPEYKYGRFSKWFLRNRMKFLSFLLLEK